MLDHPLGTATYTDEGEGPAVLLVHGLPGSHRDWRYLAACLDGFRVVRLDMPGFGGSKSCGAAVSLETRSNFVLEAINALRLSTPLVIGHSMGGPVVAMAANRAPERLRGVGLIASPGLRRHRGAPKKSAMTVARLTSFPPLGWAMRPLIARAYQKAGFPTSLTHADRVAGLQQASQYEPTLVAREMQALSMPTLVAYADDDRLLEPEIGVELGAACPPGPRLRFPTGGHNIQKTRCSELAEALRQWTVELDDSA